VRLPWAPAFAGVTITEEAREMTSSPRIAALQQEQPRVLNIGLPAFAEELAAAKVQVLQLDWAPPAIADPRIRALLAKLT
jgi:hypothetical protein